MKRGHSVKAFGPEDYLLLPFFEPAKRLRLFIGYTLKALKEALFTGSTYDIVELWGAPGWLSIIILRLARSSKLLIVSRSNGLEPHHRQQTKGSPGSSKIRRMIGAIESCLDEIGFRSADALTVVSSFDEVFAIQRGYKNQDRLLKIENPLPDHWLNRKEDNVSQFPVIGFVGTWVPRKGNSLLIEIINLLYQCRPDIRWIVAGVGSEGKNQILHETVLMTEDVYESVEKQELGRLYSQMSLFLCLSNYESFGLVCAEAMSFGCLLVSTKVGFMHGLKNGDEFVSIDYLDAFGIAKLLVSLVDNPDDCLTISRNGYRRVQSLRWDLAVEHLETFYFKLLNRMRVRRAI